jgi:hypothetical protein
MRDRIARSLVRLYPHAWRVRYEDEFVAMLDARGLRWRDLADIAICAGREWMRLTSIGRALAIALEMWLTAIVWSLIVASIGSAITGVARWALGIESTLTLPFLTMDLARSFFVEVPKAIALGAAFVAPRLIFGRPTDGTGHWPIVVRLALVTPFIVASLWFVLTAEQLAGVVAAGWILSGRVGPRTSALMPGHQR